MVIKTKRTTDILLWLIPNLLMQEIHLQRVFAWNECVQAVPLLDFTKTRRPWSGSSYFRLLLASWKGMWPGTGWKLSWADYHGHQVLRCISGLCWSHSAITLHVQLHCIYWWCMTEGKGLSLSGKISFVTTPEQFWRLDRLFNTQCWVKDAKFVPENYMHCLRRVTLMWLRSS